MSNLKDIVESAFELRGTSDFNAGDTAVVTAVEEAMAGLDAGTLRVAEKQGNEWIVNDWLKTKHLLSAEMGNKRGTLFP